MWQLDRSPASWQWGPSLRVAGEQPASDTITKSCQWWNRIVQRWESESCLVVSISWQPHGLTVHGILQAKILDWVGLPFSRGSSQPRGWTQVSCIAGGLYQLSYNLCYVLVLLKCHLGTHTKETRSERDTCTPMFIAALFIIARTWKQPRCPSADEWIRKLWYIYTMEYYSAIKKNSFESVLMRWMKLEPIIQVK